MNETARTAPGYLKKSVIYQIFLRMFTPEGTLNSAAKMLPHLAGLGVDVLYLCPVTEADDDMRTEFWSNRQNRCGLGNPKNPYRVKDYYRIDPEYGSDADLKRFTAYAHELGMRVILDLVYYHCGPAAVFIGEHPDFVKRAADGSVRNGLWHFPELNFDSPALREYLWENMAYFVREFDVDGYRCDVSDAVPLDFWEEGRRRLEALRPDVMMLAESAAREEQRYAFDVNYAFGWSTMIREVFRGAESPSKLREEWERCRGLSLPGARLIRVTENHDIANDLGEQRPDREIGLKGHDAMLVINFCIDGVPFLYCGQEIADRGIHSLWANRFYGHGFGIDWSSAETPEGKARFELVQTLIRLRHFEEALSCGETAWLRHSAPDSVIAFTRNSENQNLLIAVNCRNAPVSAEIENVPARSTGPEILLAHGAGFNCSGSMRIDFQPYGFMIAEY